MITSVNSVPCADPKKKMTFVNVWWAPRSETDGLSGLISAHFRPIKKTPVTYLMMSCGPSQTQIPEWTANPGRKPGEGAGDWMWRRRRRRRLPWCCEGRMTGRDRDTVIIIISWTPWWHVHVKKNLSTSLYLPLSFFLFALWTQTVGAIYFQLVHVKPNTEHVTINYHAGSLLLQHLKDLNGWSLFFFFCEQNKIIFSFQVIMNEISWYLNLPGQGFLKQHSSMSDDSSLLYQK